MALITCSIYSEVLQLTTTMTVIIPQQFAHLNQSKNSRNDGRYPTLYLLHGMSDDHSNWVRYSLIERYANEHQLAVVMPQADLSFYTDMTYGNKYWTFITEELPVVARSLFPLSSAREDNFVAGFSMGGYGAFKWALRHPEQFAAAASISGALDITSTTIRNLLGDRYRYIFGEHDPIGTEDDLIHLLAQTNDSNEVQPLFYQCVGTKDYLYEMNQTFRLACEQTNLDYTYLEHPDASHDWNYSDASIKEIMNWLPIRP
ncbi:esterase family protein [Paenibacillus albiflavus]|uniref:Esterase family protein n=1 Tax=Paenibacillus albiflavus TaxID=2545760 RepID=A0A4R4EET3_9BACL|nr:alpha/beta hydrolase family protein [Paenibacillus albiflavus]TCZ76578.1 esterase family protein [Paenibacillus albiflavus]